METDNFYPKDGNKKVKLPQGINFGQVKVDSAYAYHLKSPFQIMGYDNIKMFIDIESPHESHKAWIKNKDWCKTPVHLGISGNIIAEPTKNSNVKPHIDIYITKDEIQNLIESLQECKKGLEENKMAIREPTMFSECLKAEDFKEKEDGAVVFDGVITSVKDVSTMYGLKPMIEVRKGERVESLFINNASMVQLCRHLTTDDVNWKGRSVEIKKERDEKFNKPMLVVYPLVPKQEKVN